LATVRQSLCRALKWRLAVERAEKVEMVTSLQSSFSTAGSIVVAQNAG
jgi:hypothetical protein